MIQRFMHSKRYFLTSESFFWCSSVACCKGCSTGRELVSLSYEVFNWLGASIFALLPLFTSPYCVELWWGWAMLCSGLLYWEFTVELDDTWSNTPCLDSPNGDWEFWYGVLRGETETNCGDEVCEPVSNKLALEEGVEGGDTSWRLPTGDTMIWSTVLTKNTIEACNITQINTWSSSSSKLCIHQWYHIQNHIEVIGLCSMKETVKLTIRIDCSQRCWSDLQ